MTHTRPASISADIRCALDRSCVQIPAPRPYLHAFASSTPSRSLCPSHNHKRPRTNANAKTPGFASQKQDRRRFRSAEGLNEQREVAAGTHGEAGDDDDRAEDLFAHNLHVGLHVSEDGGFDKVSGTFDSCASSDYTSALLNTMLNVAEDALGEEVGVK